jgi:hypothetical protein
MKELVMKELVMKELVMKELVMKELELKGRALKREGLETADYRHQLGNVTQSENTRADKFVASDGFGCDSTSQPAADVVSAAVDKGGRISGRRYT